VCPNTTVTLTCTASAISSLTWADQIGDIATFARNDSTPNKYIAPYILSYFEENSSGFVADFTSTLKVPVSDIPNGTDIACRTFTERKHLLIYQEGVLF
jgi:hypothetical protein